MQKLMSSRYFAPLFWCQFFSAFNDNLLKNGLIALILFSASSSNSSGLVQIAGAIFILPFFILSALGGEIADLYDKAMIARRLKFAEIFVALLAAVGFVMHAVFLLLFALGLFGVIAALFGPIKYGILPDHLETKELPNANALIEGATFIAILAATILGTKIGANDASGLGLASLMVILALLSWLSSRSIPSTQEASNLYKINFNILVSTFKMIITLKKDTKLWRITLAVSWFWLVGAVVLGLLATLIKERIGGSEDLFIICIMVFTIGIAFGSMLAARLAHGRINLNPALYGLILMGFFGIDLGLTSLSVTTTETNKSIVMFFSSFTGARFIVDLAALAAASGLFIVPIFAGLQSWAAKDERARIIAANNIVNAFFIVAGALISATLQASFGINEPQQFIIIGFLCLALAPFFWKFILHIR